MTIFKRPRTMFKRPRGHTRRFTGATLVASLVALTLFAAACGNDGADTSTDQVAATTTADQIAATTTTEQMARPDPPVTQGPSGQPASPSSEIVLTASERSQIRDGDYTASMVWHVGGAFTEAVSKGAREAFEDFGIEVLSESEAGFDAAQQANNVETAMAQSPDIMLTLAVDPVAAAGYFQPVVDAGVQLVLLSNVPDGYEQGTDYVGLVTDDLAGIGIAAADLLSSALNGQGTVGYIFHDAEFYVTNQRDQAFKTWTELNHPGIEIVVEQGFGGSGAEEIANAMLTRFPDIDGIYTPWAAAADGVLAALNAAGNDDVAVVTIDLDTNVSLDLVEGGNMVGIAADEAYELGRTMATEAAFGLLDKDVPPFVIVPTIRVTADNIVEAYRQSLATDPPQEVLDALDR